MSSTQKKYISRFCKAAILVTILFAAHTFTQRSLAGSSVSAAATVSSDGGALDNQASSSMAPGVKAFTPASVEAASPAEIHQQRFAGEKFSHIRLR